MDYSHKLLLSYYKIIAALQEEHKIYLVQHCETGEICVKKILDVYNVDVYRELMNKKITGIPQIIDYYEEQGQLFLLEKYVSGTSLQKILDSSEISLDQLLSYLIELCHILQELHSLRIPIVHRDLKPSNIIITEYDHVVLLDFNAAKFSNMEQKSDTILLGTVGYAAPEQYGFGASTPKTDIYALGVIFKELSEKVSKVPRRLQEILNKCTEINPEDRYASVCELEQDIQKMRYPETGAKESKTTVQSFLPPGFRSKKPWKMLAATAAYVYISMIMLSLEPEVAFEGMLWFERGCCLLLTYLLIFTNFNYRDMQRIIPLCKNKDFKIRILGIVLLNVLLISLVFILMLCIESIIW